MASEPQQRERFVFGVRMFDVAAAKRIVAQEKSTVRPMPVASLMPLLMMVAVDPDHAEALDEAALATPLIAVTASDGRQLLIDGYHRLYRLAARGRETAAIHVLSAEQSARVELSPRPWGDEVQSP
jgi:hypothetical protein